MINVRLAHAFANTLNALRRANRQKHVATINNFALANSLANIFYVIIVVVLIDIDVEMATFFRAGGSHLDLNSNATFATPLQFILFIVHRPLYYLPV